MRRVIRRMLGLVGAMLLLVGVPTAAPAQAPDGPRLAFIRQGSDIFDAELATLGPRGERRVRLAKTPAGGLSVLEGFSFSPDGSKLAFGLSLEGKEGIYTVSPGGGRPRFVTGTHEGITPVFSTDGETLAFTRLVFGLGEAGRSPFISSSVWLVDAGGGRPQRVIPWRKELLMSPTSFSPDGAILALSRRALHGGRRAVIGMRLADRSTFLIAKGMQEAVFSPDGTLLAAMRVRPRRDVPRHARRLLAGSDLYVLRPDGTERRRLTFEPNALKSSPSWDPSGERLLFVRAPSKPMVLPVFVLGKSVIEINADGTCRHRLLFEPQASYLTAAWQPGPGREAGPISC
jgi:Tol biopolymer transport system component